MNRQWSGKDKLFAGKLPDTAMLSRKGAKTQREAGALLGAATFLSPTQVRIGDAMLCGNAAAVTRRVLSRMFPELMRLRRTATGMSPLPMDRRPLPHFRESQRRSRGTHSIPSIPLILKILSPIPRASELHRTLSITVGTLRLCAFA